MAGVMLIQEELEKRADARLKSEIDEAFSGWEKFQYSDNNAVRISLGKDLILLRGPGGLMSVIKDQLFAIHKQSYRNDEITAFLKEVNNLRQQLQSFGGEA